MSDWRQMEAGKDLDRIVAERLGIKVELREFENPLIYRTFTQDTEGWFVVLPDGRKWWVGCDSSYTADHAWWVAFDGMGNERLPHYSRNANAALALWGADSRWAVYPAWPEDYARGKFCAMFPGHGDQDAGDAFADTPALAIVRAWLEWKDGTRWIR